jgi:predicted ferric reductase
MRRVIRLVWAGAYFAVVLVPLVLALGSDRPAGANAAYEISLACGLVALSLLAVTYVLPKRVRALSAGLGIETVLGVHRLVGMSALGFVLVHVAAVLMTSSHNLALLNVMAAPPRARAALGASAALLLLVLTSALRRRLVRRYEIWRGLHLALSMAVLALSALHVYWLHHLVAEPVFARWFALLLALVLFVSLRRWVWRPLKALIRPYLVREVRAESPTVTTLVLEPWGHRGLRFRPGQFAWVRFGRTPFGFEEHPFTLASPPRRGGEIEFTVKNLGDFSGAVGRVGVGDRVWVDGPHGAFTPDAESSRGLALIAGGVGITPMISVLRSLASRGDRREHILFVSARSPEELLFRQEISAIAERIPLTVVELLDQPPAGWTGETGFIREEVLDRRLPADRDELDYYLCGPPLMVSAVGEALDRLGVPPERVNTEKFDFV